MINRIGLLKLFIPGILVLSCSDKPTAHLREIKPLSYPSASGIEFADQKLYIIGDDATRLLLLDSSFVVADSLQLYTNAERRIPKDVKPDLEAITAIRYKDSMRLLLLGSGSLSPHRNIAWLIDPVTQQKTEWKLDTFYRRLQSQLPELNIEGACFLAGSVVLSNRGHKGFPMNHLILTSPGFLADQTRCSLRLVKIGANEDTAHFQGVSGLAYSRRSDKLFLTVSTEDTRSVYEDGAIGKSYLWIVDNISSKRRWGAINPDRIIDLEAADSRFKGQKIESVCLLKETRHFYHLAMVADNDDGSSTLFKFVVEKK